MKKDKSGKPANLGTQKVMCKNHLYDYCIKQYAILCTEKVCGKTLTCAQSMTHVYFLIALMK